jgi:xanthine dehydrogenase YagS FAD-binding subunit
VRDRASYAFALVSIAAIVEVSGGTVSSARLAFGGVGAMPWRNRDAEALLIGKAPSRPLFDQAADSVLSGAHGSGCNDFKIPLLRRTLVACLSELTGVA